MSDHDSLPNRREILAALALSPFVSIAGCSDPHPTPSQAPDPSPLSPNRLGLPAALAYLASEMDVHHRVTVVYDDLESGGERYIPSGWMRGRGDRTLEWDDDAKNRFSVTHVEDSPKAGPTCLRIAWKPAFADEWVALTWQYPEDNWGSAKGLDLSGATRVTWFSRGKTGNEVVDFKFGAIKGTQPYSDSCETLVKRVRLGKAWDEEPQTFDLKGQDLSCMISGFSVAMSAQHNPDGCEFYLDEITIDHAWLDEPRLVRSYHVGEAPLKENWGLRNCCFLYDNSLLICALLSSDDDKYHNRARLIADAMVALAGVEAEPGVVDGPLRLRNAYACGSLFGRFRATGYQPVPRLPGWLNRGNEPPPAVAPWLVDAYSQGTDSGNMAWACLAFLNCFERTEESKYLQTAKRLASWVIEHCSANALGFGFTGGVCWDVTAKAEQPVAWTSSEHNIDLSAVFRRLRKHSEKMGLAQEAMKWHSAEERARRFVQWALAQGKDHVVTGTNEGKPEPAMDPKPLDVNPWAVLAFPEDRMRYAPALDWAARTQVPFGTCYIRKEGGLFGFGFSTVSKDIWPEGMGQVAVARQSLGQDAEAAAVLVQLDRIQQIHARKNPAEAGALPAAYPQRVDTGFPMIIYLPYAHIGAGSWYVMAHTRFCPFDGLHTSGR